MRIIARIKEDPVDHLLFGGICLLFLMLPIATGPAVGAGLFVLAVWILSGRFLADLRRWSGELWFWLVVGLVALPWAGLLWSLDPIGGLGFARKSYYWLLAFAVASLATSRKDPALPVKCYILGLSVHVVVILLQGAGIVPLKYATPGLIGYVTFSVLLGFGIVLLSFCFRISRGKEKIGIALLLAGHVAALAVIPGRAGYMVFIVLSPWILYNLLGRKRLWIVAVASAVVVGIFFSSSTVRERMALGVHEVLTYSDRNWNTAVGLRLHMWEGAIRITRDNPVIGVGTGGYAAAMTEFSYDPEMPVFEQPHNSFLHMTVSYGVFGLLLLLGLLAHLAVRGWKSRDRIDGFAVLVFSAVMVIAGFFDSYILSVSTGHLLALFAGLASWGVQRKGAVEETENDFKREYSWQAIS
jgi:O-antigen ligase